MRVLLYIITNIAVVIVASIVLSILGVDRAMMARGLDYYSLLVFALVFGFAGSLISLFMSKTMAKMSVRAQVITTPANQTERWLVDTVHRLAKTAGIGLPEVAIYEGEPNAFATGAFKNSALVAVSTGLLRSMNHEEVEAVLAHEVSHIANGDMVTMCLLQGVVNTFVIFLARVVGFFVDSALSSRDSERRSGTGMGYFLTVMVCEIAFGFLASFIVAWFSRRREFRADAGSAKLMGRTAPMIHALERLGGIDSGALPRSLAVSGISNTGGLMALLRTHPPIEKRIEALQNLRQ